MSLITALILSIVALVVLFCMMVLACAFALGRMHVWLKGKAEVFGDNEGLREHIGEIHGQLIEARSEINAIPRAIKEFEIGRAVPVRVNPNISGMS